MIQLKRVEQLSKSKHVNNPTYEIENSDSQKPQVFPRVYRDFIGISHQLQKKRQERRKVQEQEKTIAARVVFLEKQESMARKQIKEKKIRFSKLMDMRERQEDQSQQKSAWRASKQQQLHQLKQQNEYIRVVHKSNMNNAYQSLHQKNHSDYEKAKQKLVEGQAYKRYKQYENYQEKREHAIDMSIDKEKGKMRIDKFFKMKNKEHLAQYKNRMRKQQSKVLDKMASIKRLETRQHSLRDKLEHSTLRASRMQELILKVSRTIDTTGGHGKKHKQPTNTTGIGSHAMSERNSASRGVLFGQGQDVQENIDLNNGEIAEMQKEIKIVRKRRRNKHANRYQNYQDF